MPVNQAGAVAEVALALSCHKNSAQLVIICLKAFCQIGAVIGALNHGIADNGRLIKADPGYRVRINL